MKYPLSTGVWLRSYFGVGVGIGIGIGKTGDGIRTRETGCIPTANENVGWAYRFCKGLKGHRNARDQLLRASHTIPLNTAEGNGKATRADETWGVRLRSS